MKSFLEKELIKAIEHTALSIDLDSSDEQILRYLSFYTNVDNAVSKEVCAQVRSLAGSYVSYGLRV